MLATISSRTAGWLVASAGALALVAGGVIGVRLGEAASAPRVDEIRVADPGALPPVSGIEARSPAGFTGFGGPPALEGEVLRRGVATDVRPGAFTLVEAGARLQVEFTQPLRLYRITSLSGPAASLRAGDSVVVRFEDGRATGVLRVRQASGPPAR